MRFLKESAIDGEVIIAWFSLGPFPLVSAGREFPRKRATDQNPDT